MEFSNVNVKTNLQAPTKTSGKGTLTQTEMKVEAPNTLTAGVSYYLECTPKKVYKGTFAGTDPANKSWLVFTVE